MIEPTPFMVTWRNALRDDRKLSSKAKVVGYTLAQHTNADGKNAYPSYETIAAESSLARSSVAAAIRELAEKKWVVRKSGSGEVHPNVYELRLPPSVSRTVPARKAPSKSRRGTVRVADAKESKARSKSKTVSQGTTKDQAVGEETRARADGVDAETEDEIRAGRANEESDGAVVIELDSARDDHHPVWVDGVDDQLALDRVEANKARRSRGPAWA